ncbi:MAG: (d)CMP kinase [Methylococcus sp.]|nr:MAG: (d)CMP kinase [Methylococcus sp.]
MTMTLPVLTIDGPSGSGKGTVSRAVAKALGWHFLDSGAIYRSLAFAALQSGMHLDDEASLAELAVSMDLVFSADDPPQVWLDGIDIALQIGTETVGNAASCVAQIKGVREALLQKQLSFKKPPGLVADGRDMGSVVFKEAPFKVFLTASAEVRAKRRLMQLKDKGHDVNLNGLISEIEQRDRRDLVRTEAPLVRAEGAVLIDSSDLSIDEVIRQVMKVVQSDLDE